jgi:hypothetical protein
MTLNLYNVSLKPNVLFAQLGDTSSPFIVIIVNDQNCLW